MNLKKTVLPIAKWICICFCVGIFSGCASAFFLVSLEWVTQYREKHNWIIWLLPVGGLAIGLLYHFYGKEVAKGNNLLLEEYENPQKTIPFRMAPLVLIGTLITHLFGGSAGREGTAVQMGGAIADQFSRCFLWNASDRKTLLILGISAGFASVFGTPLAGALFSLEIVFSSKFSFKSVVCTFLTAFIAYFTVEFWQIQHTHYSIPMVPEWSIIHFSWIIVAGVVFGITAMLFARSSMVWSKLFSKYLQEAPLRPFAGGLVLVAAIYFMGTTQYIGLGIPTIVDAFSTPSPWYDFLLKILFTGFTLGAGFKGGEVTPLFFIGATLGSTLSMVIPLPIALLAGMGFVAVFSGATHTPIACTIMGMELFGVESGIYLGIACIIAYYSSGTIGIYRSQIVKGAKFKLYQGFKRKELEDF
jgi:H+/Cl- antiporter ClcA